MKCNNCGAENRNNVKYCTQCGKLIEEINQQESNVVDTEKSFSNNITENETIQEEGLIYSCDNANCGISSGILKAYEDRLLFISNKGKEILYKYSDIHKVSDSLGCVVIIAIDGRTDSFAVNKNIRSKIVEYINNQQIVKENRVKVPVTNTISNEEVTQKVNELKDKTNKTINMAKDDIKNFKTISRKKQIIYVAITIAIIIILIGMFNNNSNNDTSSVDVSITSSEQLDKMSDTDQRAINIVWAKMSETLPGYKWSEIKIVDKDGYGRYIIYVKATNSSTGDTKYSYKFVAYSEKTENYYYNVVLNANISTVGFSNFDYKNNSTIKWGQPLSAMGVEGLE